MGLYLDYHTRYHPLPSDGEANQSTSLIGGWDEFRLHTKTGFESL